MLKTHQLSSLARAPAWGRGENTSALGAEDLQTPINRYHGASQTRGGSCTAFWPKRAPNSAAVAAQSATEPARGSTRRFRYLRHSKVPEAH